MNKPKKARTDKPAPDQPTYSTSELCARYRCSQLTLRRMTASKGYPEPAFKVGHEYQFMKAAVHAWERIHIPALHADAADLGDDEKHWERLHRFRVLEREESLAKSPIPDPKRAKKAHGKLSP